MTTKTEKIQCAESIIDYANRRTIGEMINEPGLYEAIRTTNLYLKRYVNNIKTACKDCGYMLLPEERREKMDNGDILCGQCSNEAEVNAKVDSDTREDALIN